MYAAQNLNRLRYTLFTKSGLTAIPDFQERPVRKFDRMLDIEAALQSTDLNLAKILHEHEFLVLCNEGGPVSSWIKQILGLTLFTSYDGLREFLEHEPRLSSYAPEPMRLAPLAKLLGDRVDFDALFINPYRKPQIDPWPPGRLVDLRAGRDPRPEARMNHARTLAELHAFLDQERMVREDRTHQLEYATLDGEEKLVAHYRGTVLGRRAKSYRFEPVVAYSDPLSFGEGPSELLCPGFLLEQVHLRLTMASETSFREQKTYPEIARETFRLTRELAKLMEGRTEFARRTLRTVLGAAFVRKEWNLANPKWIANALVRAEQLAETE